MKTIYPERYRKLEEDKIVPVKVWTRDRLKINIEQMQRCQGKNITYTELIDNVLDIYETSQGVDNRHPYYHKNRSDVANLTSILHSALTSFLTPETNKNKEDK